MRTQGRCARFRPGRREAISIDSTARLINTTRELVLCRDLERGYAAAAVQGRAKGDRAHLAFRTLTSRLDSVPTLNDVCFQADGTRAAV